MGTLVHARIVGDDEAVKVVEGALLPMLVEVDTATVSAIVELAAAATMSGLTHPGVGVIQKIVT
jgi:hypothetical protein